MILFLKKNLFNHAHKRKHGVVWKHTQAYERYRRCPTLDTFTDAVFDFPPSVTSVSCREQWDVIAESAEQVTFFLASKMSVALSPPSLPHQESINNHSEWQNGFGQWDIRGMHKLINKGAAWRRSPISKCHTQWVSVRPNTVSTQACSKLSNHCHFILTDSPNSSIRKCEKANIEQVILKRRSQTVWCSVQVFTSYLSKSQACPSWNSQTQIVIITT